MEAPLSKRAIVIHSGGLDSSLCLDIAREEHGSDAVLSLSFDYQQRHSAELVCAARIAADWGIDHAVVDIKCLTGLTRDALTGSALAVTWKEGEAPTSLVVGRNGLMARLGAIHAHHLGAGCIYMGIMEEEARLVGYRDCSRHYMDLMENVLRVDLDNSEFAIRTPLVACSKADVLSIAYERGILDYLLQHTISCYQGIPGRGCTCCPSCILKLRALDIFQTRYPNAFSTGT
jgi:7-cyano-7-deazaguanine synthase